MSKTTKPKMISLRIDQMEWLKKNPHINVSGITQQILDLLMKEKVSINDIITKKNKGKK